MAWPVAPVEPVSPEEFFSAPLRTVHKCDDGRCPCYVQGQEDLAMALRVMERHGLPTDKILGKGEGGDGH